MRDLPETADHRRDDMIVSIPALLVALLSPDSRRVI